MIIAIDGPSGAGKSTVAKLVGKKLNLEYIDTGAMYRALAYKAYKNNLNICEDIIAQMLKKTKIDYRNNSIYLDGENVDKYIRNENISKASSKISALKIVRIKMVDLQRQMAKNKSIIMDGRDIGTNVFPYADFKFFITASVEERAQRRFDELQNKGFTSSYDEVLNQIKKRDDYDSNRQIAPLKIAKDAIYIDTTKMNIDETVNYIIDHVGGKHAL